MMSSPREPGRDLRLERLDDRDGSRRAYLGEAAQVRLLDVSARRVGEFSAAYQALIDAVFTAPGAAEWLAGMWQRVTTILGERDAARHHTARHPATASDAICAAKPGPGRL